MWDFCSITTPVARKEYECDGIVFIDECGYDEEFTPEEIAVINNCRKNGRKIFKGDKYIRVTGMWDGQWVTFRARPEINEICAKYDLYVE